MAAVNAFDSLVETLLVRGDATRALLSCGGSVRLNPMNEATIKLIASLCGKH